VRGRAAAFVALFVALTEVACSGALGGPSGSPSTSPAASGPAAPSALAADWSQYHGSAARTGVGPAVPALGSAKVAWSAPVDGAVYASPLIVAGHVIVATENNTVYSLDLFSGSVVWKTHLGEPVVASTLPCGNVSPVSGITGTPAADPATGRMYVVAFLTGRHHLLFTLSLTNGAVVNQQDVDPVDSNPAVQQQRGALALASGYVYVPLGGLFGDCGAYHGYVVGVPLVGPGPSLTYKTPGAREAGIWSSAGPTVALSGRLYVVTGNGSSGSAFDYGNTVVELTPTLQVQSYFAPANWKSLNASDTDLGSVGATLIPSMGVVVSIGKEGVAYVLKADQLGGIGGQVASRQVCSGAWGGTAWAGGTVYVPCADGLVALAVTPTSVDVAWRASHPALGSPIIAAGAVWAIEADTGTLYALDPSSGAVLYSVGVGKANHFSTPAATEGFVVSPAGSAVVAIAIGS
jgi:outer membrane protein assembly factor BamB